MLSFSLRKSQYVGNPLCRIWQYGRLPSKTRSLFMPIKSLKTILGGTLAPPITSFISCYLLWPALDFLKERHKLVVVEAGQRPEGRLYCGNNGTCLGKPLKSLTLTPNDYALRVVGSDLIECRCLAQDVPQVVSLKIRNLNEIGVPFHHGIGSDFGQEPIPDQSIWLDGNSVLLITFPRANGASLSIEVLGCASYEVANLVARRPPSQLGSRRR